ncbi:hypothetical protein jhhlp_003846 [Lomentospora prolificans]|uniref:Pyridoxamine 5'-phosphate oxidase Alr4036 family FMN-binding domain-containing protein n=1 Tax=Lomentospora prolificans TaxID=41688 RepID=A0A2N3NA36_9PEZI|nr:hypothetical protein jhhlp_003846 [Lomentospora prolificans]
MLPSPPSQAVAPWRADFLSHLTQLGLPTCVLSTVRATSTSTETSSSLPFAATTSWVPRARTAVFRGMWAALPENENNPAERNPLVYESDMLSMTTDARMDKAQEIAPDDCLDGARGTGGGGPFEAVFWIPDAMTQWRFSGKAYLLGQDVDSDGPAAVRVRETLLERMRKVGDGAFSWSREITGHFGNMSPLMRGSFKNPPPGRPVAEGTGGEGLGLGQRVEDLGDEIARRNFRVVVLVPDEVDRVDLSESDKAKRWRYRYVGEESDLTWETTEVWP